MKKLLRPVMVIILTGMVASPLIGQGWYAEGYIDINHANYGREEITSATVNYSGQSSSFGAQPISRVSFSFSGTGTPSGSLSVSASGIAIGNYYPGDPLTISFSASYSGTHTIFDCATYGYRGDSGGGQEVYVSIRVYPRTTIKVDSRSCTDLTLSTTSCGSNFSWRVADPADMNWKPISGETGSTMTITSADLTALGLTPYGTKYYQASASPNTFSLSEPAELYYPGPTASVGVNAIKCHNAADGVVSITGITGAHPSITSFVVTLFKDVSTVIKQEPITGSNISFSGLGPGTYWVRIQNNSSIGTYGSCFVDDNSLTPLTNPTAVTIQNFTVVDAISCYGKGDGTLRANPSGGTGSYTEYTWTPNVSTTSEAHDLGADSYKVKVKDSNGCQSAEATHNFAQPDPINAVLTSTGGLGGYDVSCLNKTDGKITSSTSGGNGGYTYAWSNGGSSSSISDLGVGSYTLTVTDVKECTGTATEVLTAPDAIDFTINIVAEINCPAGTSGSLGATSILNTIGTHSFLWSSGETSQNVFGKTQGTYSLTISDEQGCSSTKSKSLVDPEPYIASITVLSDFNGASIQCNGGDNGKLGILLFDEKGLPATATNFEWFLNEAPLTSGLTQNNISGLTEGLYEVDITYKGTCKLSASKLLSDPDPISPIITIPSTNNHHGTHISCPGESDGSLHAIGSGGTGTNYTFSWGTGETGADLTNKPAGTYIVTATDVNGCVGSASEELKDPDPITPHIDIISYYNGFPIKCHNSSDGHLRASAAGGTNDFTYTWNTGITTADLTNIGSGTYTATATDENGCSNAVSLEVIPPAQVTTSIAVKSDYHGQAISCHNLSDGWLQAMGAGGVNTFTHTWSTGLVDPDLSGVPAGTYTVTTTDANGCPATAEVTIDNPEPVVASIDSVAAYNGYGVRCNGDLNGYIETSATGGTQQYTFSWTGTSSTTNIAEELSVGSYTVTIADENGCADSKTQVITEPDALTLGVTADEHITCFGGSTGAITLSSAGGAGAHEYSIDGGGWQSGPEFISLQARDYTLSVIDRNDCLTDVSHTLTQPDQINIDFTTVPAFCADPRGEATAAVAGGVGSYRYEWFDEDHTSMGTDTFIEKLYAGVYTLTVHDGNDCPMTESVGIVASDGAQAGARETIPASCSYSSDGIGELEIISGTGPFEFTWPDGQTGARGVNLAGGTYLVTINDGNSCKTIYSVAIPSPEALDAEAVEVRDVSCHGNCDGSITLAASGGVGNYQYNWTDQNGAQAVGLCAGDHAVVISDANGCVFEKTFTMLQPAPLAFTPVERTLPLCNGDCNGSLEAEAFGGNGAYQYAWTSGSLTALAENLCAGDYTLTVTDEKNCVLERTYNLGQPPPMQLLLSEQTQPTCFGGCDGVIQVQTTGGTGTYDYTWSNTVATPRIADLCAGDYTVTATDDNNCVISQAYTITNPPALSIDLGSSVTLCVGQKHRLDAGTSWATYAWNSNTGFTASTQEIEITDPGQYWLEVFSVDGCVARDTFLLENSLDLLEASFLIPKEAVVQDTVAIIDVSWPLPDQTEWSFPVAMRKVVDLGEVVFGQFDEPGIYEVGLTTHLAKCTDHISKTILILKGSEEPEGGRLGHKEYVKEFTLYPNPTEGNFEVKVEFVDEGPAILSVWNTPMGHLVKKVQDEGKTTYHWYMDLRPLSAGTYVIRLDHVKGRRYIRFVVR